MIVSLGRFVLRLKVRTEHLIFAQRYILNSIRPPYINQPPSRGLLTVAYYLHSFDYPIRPVQHGLRNREADLLCRLEIDYQLELGRLLYWDVGGFATLQNLIHVGSSPPPQVLTVRAVRHETTGINKTTTKIDCRQLVPSGKINNLL